MASEEFYGDGGGSDYSGSEFDDEPFDVQSPLEKMRLILHSLDTETTQSEELTKKREEAKKLLEYLKELETSDMTHIEEFRGLAPTVVQYATTLGTYEIFYDDLINMYEEKVDDADDANDNVEKERCKAIVKQLKAHDASGITTEDRAKVYKTIVDKFLE